MSNNKNQNRKNDQNTRKPGSHYREERINKERPYGCAKPATKGVEYNDVTTNDIGWWDKFKELYDPATKANFDKITGAAVQNLTGPQPNTSVTVNNTGDAIPGIMRINYIPVIGVASDANDPVNQLFNTMYADIASKTSGALQLQQADLAMFVTSMSSIVTSIGVIRRAFEYYNVWMAKNYYYPYGLLDSMWMNVDDIKVNYNSYLSQFNALLVNFNHLGVPNFVDVFARHYALAHNVWIDEANSNAQLELFFPVGGYVYDDTSETGGMLKYTDSPYRGMVGCLQFLNRQLEAWRNSSDLPTITGAILRAYPDADLLTFPLMQGGEVAIPTTDTAIGWQINNLVTMSPDITSLDVTQDPVHNLVLFKPKWSTTPDNCVMASLLNGDGIILNSYDETTDAKFFMESTRLVPTVSTTANDFNYRSCGVELVVSFTIYTFSYEGGSRTTASYTYHSASVVSGTVDEGRQFSLLTKFRNHPRVYLYDTVSPTEYTVSGFVGDINVYTRLTTEQRIGLDRAALYSAYMVRPAVINNNR